MGILYYGYTATDMVGCHANSIHAQATPFISLVLGTAAVMSFCQT